MSQINLCISSLISPLYDNLVENVYSLCKLLMESTDAPYVVHGVQQEGPRTIRTPDGLHQDAWGSVTYSFKPVVVWVFGIEDSDWH